MKRKVILMYRSDEEKRALSDIVETAVDREAVVGIGFETSRSLDEYRRMHVYPIALVCKVAEMIRLTLAVHREKPEIIAFCTPHPAFRILRSIFPWRVRLICYLRTQHFLQIPQSLSDRIRLRARRMGLRMHLFNSYAADFYLLPGKVNLDYVRWCDARPEQCKVIGYYPKVRLGGRGPARIVLATQNWSGHGFADVAKKQKAAVTTLYAKLEQEYPGTVVLRPHPRENEPYTGLRRDTAPGFIDTINSEDIIVSDLSSLVGDCWVRGARIVLWAVAGSYQYNQAVYQTYKVLPSHTPDEVVAEIARLRSGQQAASEAFCRLLVSERQSLTETELSAVTGEGAAMRT